MTQRIRVEVPTYMPVGGGQWDIVLPGSVFDVPDSMGIKPGTATVLSPAEPAGTLPAGVTHAPVRNDRRKK